MRRKKVLFHTDLSLSNTGFGKFAKCVLEYLYRLNKFDIVHLCIGAVDGMPELSRTPWKSIGAVNPQKLQEIKNQNNPQSWGDIDRSAGYGAFSLDEVVKREKPDVVQCVGGGVLVVSYVRRITWG